MVVLTIIVTVTTIVITNQSSFNRTLILSNTAYDIALTLRSAQTYGLSSRARGVVANVGYGIRLQSGSPGSFMLFADTSPAASCGTPDCKPGNYVYTSGADALVQTYTLGNGITISNFCAWSNFSWACSSNGGLTSLDIVFVRPNADPFMSKNGAYQAAPFTVTTSCLSITSPQGGTRFVSVTSSGQIIANAASCGP